MPRKDANTGPISAQAQQDLVSEGIENFELPKSIVTKIAKSAIPENAKLQKETVLSLLKGSTVFINYLAATAHDVALSKQHKSISASDVLKGLEMIEFGDLVDKLQVELQVYRDQAKTDKGKKGTTSVNQTSSSTAKKPATATSALSIPPLKLKGKEKATNPLPSPFTSVPLPSMAGGSISSGPGVPMEVDADAPEEDATMEDSGEVENEAEAIEDDEEEIEDEDEDEEQEDEEELEDRMAIEEQELKNDHRGLDKVDDDGDP